MWSISLLTYFLLCYFDNTRDIVMSFDFYEIDGRMRRTKNCHYLCPKQYWPTFHILNTANSIMYNVSLAKIRNSVFCCDVIPFYTSKVYIKKNLAEISSLLLKLWIEICFQIVLATFCYWTHRIFNGISGLQCFFF